MPRVLQAVCPHRAATGRGYRRAVLVVGITAIGAVSLSPPIANAARTSLQNPAPPGIVWRQEWMARSGSGILSIAAPSPHQVWAIEGRWTGRSSSYSIVHWNGRRWRVSGMPDPGFVPAQVRASSPDSVWIVGDALNQPAAEIWNGQRWHQIPLPASPYNPFVVLGPSDAWITSLPGLATPLWHWNGSEWHRYQIPATLGYIDSLAGNSGANLWAAAIQSRHQNSPGWLAVYHWTGTTWKQAPLRRRWIAEPPAIAASWTGDVWIEAYSKKAARGIVLHRHDAHWTQLSPRELTSTQLTLPGPVPFPPTAAGHNIWFFDSEYWNGHHIQLVDTVSSGCQDYGPENLALTGISGTTTAAWGASCPPRRGTGQLRATIMFSKHVAHAGLP